VRWRGERRPLPPEIDLSAYRIVQESVTNVVRHAGTRSCRVTVDCREDELAIEVVDRGRGRGGPQTLGTASSGCASGSLCCTVSSPAAPRPEGGFRVAARLPLPAGVR